MKRCLNCRKTYEDDLSECPHCGYKPRSKTAKTQYGDKESSRNISSNSASPFGSVNRPTNKISSQNNICSGSSSRYAGSFYIQSGERLNNKRYSVINVMGFGAFGVAYECFDNNTQRRVVVKEYMPSFLVSRSPNGRDVEPLSQEAEINFSIGVDSFIDETKKLSDNEVRCMPRLVEYFYQNKTSYVVTELVEGELLSSIIKRKGRLSYQASVSIITGVLQGLRQLNKIGVIHSDICPDNIVVTSSGSTKLLDYNLSDFNKTIYTQRDSGKLRAGYSALEMYYPEMKQGPWTDVYAAAATMYKMLTGVTVSSAVKRNNKESLVPPSKLGVSITPGAEKAMLNALTIDYKKRTQNPEDFLNGLTGDGFDNLAEDKSREPRAIKPPRPQKVKRQHDGNAVLNTVLAFLLIAIIGVVVWLFISGVFTLPAFITEKLGMEDDMSDSDAASLSSNFVGDFYSSSERESDDVSEESDEDTDSSNILDDLLSGLLSSDEESSQDESSDEYSDDYWEDESSDDYLWNDSTVSSDFFGDITSSIASAWDTTVSSVIDGVASGAENFVSDVLGQNAEGDTSSNDEYYP